MKHVLLTDHKAAEMLGCSRSSIWRLAAEGLIPKPIKIGRMSRWKLEDIDRLVEAAEERRKRQ